MQKEVLFSFFPGFTRKRARDLSRLCGSIAQAFDVSASDLRSLRWPEETLTAFLRWRTEVVPDQIEEELQREGIKPITQTDESFPPLLRHIADPPLVLFVRGNLAPLKHPIAIVGPRNASAYGKQVTQMLSADLARAGMAIVSGLALGIDGVAHESAIRAGGKTIAVLGSGIARSTVYPRAHVRLADSIIEHGGAVISEYPPTKEAAPYMFPERNRLVAGMTLGTVVIEAGIKSGSLITAALALEYSRDVFAVPQNITSPSASGVNNLLKLGAWLVTDATDVATALGIPMLTKKAAESTHADLSEGEARILQALSLEPMHVDEIGVKTELGAMAMSATLTLLEIRGLVRNLGNMNYIRS